MPFVVRRLAFYVVFQDLTPRGVKALEAEFGVGRNKGGLFRYVLATWRRCGWFDRVLPAFAMLATISEDDLLGAQAKGLVPRRIVFTCGARNAILPNIAGFAL